MAPKFSQTGHVYLYYFPSFNPDSEPPGLPFEHCVSKMSRPRISRFTMDLETKRLDLDSEVRIFEFDAQIFSCCHVGGGMGWDSEGNLYVTTGDTNSSQGTGGHSGNNQPPTCPTGPDTEASSAHCGSAAFSYQDARRTAGDTNDYNGFVGGGPASGGTDSWYDCDNLVNDSTRNTGLTMLPHSTGTGRDAGAMRPANVWYSRGDPNGANGCPDFPREPGVDGAPNYGAPPRRLCPHATANGATVMNGPVHRYDEGAEDDSVRWPEYWYGRWFLHDHGGASIKHGLLLDPETDQDGGQPVYADSLRNTPSWTGNCMDSKFGPDGALYVQVHSGFFRANPDVGLYKFENVGGPDTPAATPRRRLRAAAGCRSRSAGPAASPLVGLRRRAQLGVRDPDYAYAAAGTYDVTLTVTYADGEKASKTIKVTVS